MRRLGTRGKALVVMACLAMNLVAVSEPVKAEYSVNMSMQKDAKDGEYNRFFLKDDIQTITIDVDEEELEYLYEHAIEKACVETNEVTIGGESIGHVGLKTKGSYTLDHAVWDNKGSHRYSFTLNFGKYVKKKDYGVTQNFYGANKISLNNFFFDKSMLKEYCAWTLLSEMGLPTPQFGLTKLYINGEYFGVYFMIEALDSSILEQYYQCGDKEISDYLCKPENTNFNYDQLVENPSVLWEEDEDTYDKVSDMIPTVMDWAKRLNQLSEGTDWDGNSIDVNSEEYVELLNEVMDVDEALRYFAAHSFLVQTDNMFVGYKNFGLYVDENARSLIIPWDYDLSFGTYSPGDAESVANYDVDLMYTTWGQGTPSDKQLKKFYQDFPLFNVIYQNDSLREKMHNYMLDCSKIMALGGTTSLGKTYEPAHMVSLLKTIKEPLFKAAEEKVFVEARYMNHINQPAGVKGAFYNLEKIVGELGNKASIYKFTKSPKAKSNYVVAVPTTITTDKERNNVRMYAYTDGQLLSLDTFVDDNLVKASVDKLDYIIIVQDKGNAPVLMIVGIITGAVVLVALAAVAVVILLKRRKKE